MIGSDYDVDDYCIPYSFIIIRNISEPRLLIFGANISTSQASSFLGQILLHNTELNLLRCFETWDIEEYSSIKKSYSTRSSLIV